MTVSHFADNAHIKLHNYTITSNYIFLSVDGIQPLKQKLLQTTLNSKVVIHLHVNR